MRTFTPDDKKTRMSAREKQRKVFLLRIRFTGRTDIPAEHLHAMVKLYTLQLDPNLYEADILTLEKLAKDLDLPEAKMPDNMVLI